MFLYTTAITVLSGSETRGADPRTRGLTAALLGTTALLLVALVVAGRLEEPLVLGALVLGAAPVAYWLHRLAVDGSPAAVQTLVRLLLFGMIPLDALLLLGTGHWLAAAALLLLLLPGQLLARRVAIT